MAIVVVQATSQVGNGVTTITTPAISTTTGNWIVIDIGYYLVTGGFLSITDTVGLSWADSIAEKSIGNTLYRQRYAKVTAGNASHTFTFNSSGTSDFPSMALKEISGLDPTAPLTEVNSSAANINSPGSLSLTTAAPNDKILCGCGASITSQAETLTQTGSFIQDKNIGTTGQNCQQISSHLIIAAAGSNTFSFTFSSGLPDDFAIAISSFKIAPSGDTLFGQAVM